MSPVPKGLVLQDILTPTLKGYEQVIIHMTTEITEYELNRPQTELKREKEQFEVAIKFYENQEELSEKQKRLSVLEQKIERINNRLRQ